MALYSGRLLMRGGNEADFDPDKMMPREWAVSTDKKIVRICFAPGVCIRMATYEAFEEDMEKIEEILATCQSIQEAVIRINTEISQKADAVAEYTAQAKQYRDEAKQFRDEAETFAPSGYSELVENVEKNTVKIDTVIEKADLRIKETASGESIYLTDSADAKVVEFGLYGKATQKTTTGAQLLNYDAWKTLKSYSGTFNYENNGITITANKDDCYTAYNANDFPTDAKIPVNEGDKITLSWEESSNKSGTILIFGNNAESTTNWVNSVATNNNSAKSLNYTVPSNVTFITFRFGVATAGDTISYKNIMINKGSTPLPYEPYTGGVPSPNPNYPQDVEIAGSSGNVVVKSYGKNLLKNTAISKTESGLTFTVNDDKSVTINGTSKERKGIRILDSVTLPVGRYILSHGVDSHVNLTPVMYVQKNNNNNITYISIDAGKEKEFTVEQGDVINATIECRFANISANNITFYPMIRACDENGNPIGDDTYESYKETSSTIQTPNGLAGIPVDSGGNYTDANGQQWVCDEIVKYADGSGEYIQRVKEIVFDGTEAISASGTGFNDYLAFNYGTKDKKLNEWTKVISNAFLPLATLYEYQGVDKNGIGGNGYILTFKIHRKYLNNATGTNADNVNVFKNFLASKYNEGNPVKALYILETPIHTPLTAEQIAEIEKLCTFYPVTNIYNDADCEMKATYIVDAKKYIDNKIAELATAMINNI